MGATLCSSLQDLSIEPRGAPRGSGPLVLFTCRREVVLRNVCVCLCVHVLGACTCLLYACACACASMCANKCVCVHARAHSSPSGRGMRTAGKLSSGKPCAPAGCFSQLCPRGRADLRANECIELSVHLMNISFGSLHERGGAPCKERALARGSKFWSLTSAASQKSPVQCKTHA